MAQTEDEKAVQGIKDPTERKKAYYTRQRQKASVGSEESKKIHSKLGLGDEIRGFAKDTLGKVMASGPWSIPGGKEAEEAGAAAGGIKALASKGSKAHLVPERSTAAPMAKSVQHLGRAVPVKKALPSNQRALGSSTAPSVGSKTTSKSLATSKVKAVSGGTRGAQKALSASKTPAKVRAPRKPRAKKIKSGI